MKVILSLLVVLTVISAAGYLFLQQHDVQKPLPEERVGNTRVDEKLHKYKKLMTTDPLWYLHPELNGQLKEYFEEPEEGKSDEFIKEKRAFIQMTGDLLEKGEIKLGEPIEDFDAGRKPIEQVIIHHTDTPEDIEYTYIHGIHFYTLYVMPIFMDPENSNYGEPVYSGHYDKSGNQVFYGYHYLVKPDGSYKKALKDEYKGYHARSANTNSVGISFIGNYDTKKPSDASLQTAKKIADEYPNTKLLGHREVVPGTTCPGDTFLGKDGWKGQLTFLNNNSTRHYPSLTYSSIYLYDF